MNWDDVRVFLAVARTGTLTHAATHLKLGVATVTRRSDRLETDLGVKLFSRHQSGYFITDEGAALLSRAETLEQAGQAFETTEVNQVMGHVRLATAENLANPLIIPVPKINKIAPVKMCVTFASMIERIAPCQP